MKQSVVVVLLISVILMMVPETAKASENDVGEVLRSSFYGGLTGTLIGAAFLAFRDEPKDHWKKDIRVGAAVGVILGTVYGLWRTTQAFAEISDGRVVFHLPSLQFDVDAEDHAIRGSLDLIHVPF